MKIKILGSGGGEGYPATFCGCDHCNTARRLGGKNIRTLSQTLINDDLLIDLPEDTRLHALREGLNLGDIPNILITHAHADHFDPQILFMRGGCYAHELKYPTLNVYGSAPTLERYKKIVDTYGVRKDIFDSISFIVFEPYETKTVGKYEVTALPAKHADKIDPLNYIIKEGEEVLIYLHDTGFPDISVLDFIKGREEYRRVGCVMMDATMGTMEIDDSRGHMSFEQDKRLSVTLRRLGIADENTRFIVNHITHNKAESHEKIEEIFEGSGIEVSFDGKVIEF